MSQYNVVPMELLNRFPEINPSNYDHDDVCALNAWGVEVVLAAAPPQLQQWLGLTDEEVRSVMQEQAAAITVLISPRDQVTAREFQDALNRIARAIEAKLREKNGGDHIPDAGKMIAAGARMAAILDTSLTAPVEQWPDEAEIDEAIKEWRSVANGDHLAAAGKGIDAPQPQPKQEPVAFPEGYEIHELPADYTGPVWIEGQVRSLYRKATGENE